MPQACRLPGIISTVARARGRGHVIPHQGASVAVRWSVLATLAGVDHPVAWPALVTLGEREPGHLVMADVMSAGVLGLRDEGGQASEVLSAMLVELACAPWTAELGLLVVTADPRFADADSLVRSVLAREARGPHGLNGFLLLMHVGAGPGRTRTHLAARLPALLDTLTARGYRIVRADALLAPR